MKFAAFIVALSLYAPVAASPQTAAGVGEAYAQFLLGHRLEEADDDAGAVAAYTRAMELDPKAADIPASLAAVYLRQNKAQEAIASAEKALKLSPLNREANRVLGIVYAALAEGGGDNGRRGRGNTAGKADADENLTKAIHYLEVAIDKQPVGETDPNVRATLARLYVATRQFDKAIPMLSELVRQEPGWQDGPMMLAEAYAAAGRTGDAIAWLEQQGNDDPRLLPTLGEFYERERRWSEAAATYGRALERAPRNNDLRTRYGSALLNAGGHENAVKARDALAGASDARGMYLLSQAQRRAGDPAAAEATARKVIAQNGKSPWGYYALAEALEERHQFQAVVDELGPLVSAARGKPDASFDIAVLLPHLGFAYQELGDHDKAIATFEEARRLSPKDPAAASYLIEAQIAAKKYAAAAESARIAITENPDDLRLVRLQAQALRHSGKPEQGVAALETALKTHADDPTAYVALAQMYSEVERGAQAVQLLKDAQVKFPKDTAIAFELGATLDKQKKYPEAEAAFRQLLAREPENAAALNYLGYMLAERGERLDESVRLVTSALQLEPENGSYLDSLGWAYFKSDKLDLAETNLKKAADQLRTNSVIQEHYGEVLLKLGRFDEAIAAFTRALTGDGDSIDRADIDKKIRTAKAKLPKK